ncbi:MAG TPA: hypothetical protein VIJ79_02780 [Acidobacteriaceae bacterium]
MNAYLCTYRRIRPSNLVLRHMGAAAKQDPLLQTFLNSYDKSYYDWGDDPSFFAAQHLLRDVRKASWGVCRPDVRNVLGEGDIVVFFCGCQDKDTCVWRYYFVGFGTVLALVERAALWTDPAYAPYRKFYNVLARLNGTHLVQSEKFHPYHNDWKLRAKAPYVLFDPAHSVFDLKSPHHVATWDRTTIPETWKTDVRSRKIEHLLFTERGIDDRRLRTSPTGFGHAKLNLLKAGRTVRPGRSLSELTQALGQLV